MVSPTRRRHVLVVEDSVAFRDLLFSALTLAGYDVTAVEHGAMAIRVLQDLPYVDLILLDLAMPVMDGWTFLRLRRDDEAVSRIPVVLLTAVGGASRMNPYVGVSALVAKPLGIDELLEVVARCALN